MYESSAISGVVYPSWNISPSTFNYTYADIFRDADSMPRFYNPKN